MSTIELDKDDWIYLYGFDRLQQASMSEAQSLTGLSRNILKQAANCRPKLWARLIDLSAKTSTHISIACRRTIPNSGKITISNHNCHNSSTSIKM